MPALSTPTTTSAQARPNNFTRDLFAWLNQVKADSDLPPSAFKVAFEIGQYINRKSGEAWPSTDTIGKGIAMSKATVVEMVSRLKAGGHLDIDPGCQGRGHPNRYRLVLKDRPADLSDDRKGQRPDHQKGQPTS